jgi:hypothetical protein
MTDKVSTLNASVLDRVRHLFVGVASMSFRVAFIASITVTAINGLAPGTFITSSVPINRPITLPIGNLTLTTTRPSLDARQVFPLQRAELVTRLERVEKDQFGYDVQPNWIVGWPPLDLRLKGKVEYPSDGVRYQYECTWEPPVFQSGRWTTRRGTWGIWTSVLVPQEDKLSSFGARKSFPFLLLAYIDRLRTIPVVLPLAQGSLNVTSRSAYLFLGSNSTLDPTTAAGFRNSTLDLSGIPATYNASGFVLTDGANRSETGFYAPPLATVLECDPRMNISSVTVALETNQALRVVSDSSSPARIGNIPEGAATILLSQALLSATSTPEPYGDTNTVMNYVCASMFMADPSLSSDSGTRPLDLATISANVDAYMSSASKAYAGGYQPADDSLPIGNFSTMLVNGEMEEHKVALVTNKRLMITTIVLVGVTALLSAAITLREEEGRRPFSLMSIMWEVERRQLDLQQL